MFGTYRYCLALCVAISHLWSGMIGGPAAYAVWGFYCLSGFLMTLVLNERYGFSWSGFVTFLKNRSLRIYPSYYAVCLVMALIFLFLPETSVKFLPALQMPQSKTGWLFSLTLLTPPFQGALVHGSSALRVELWMYIVMALGLSRNVTTTAIWFTACAVNTWWLVNTGVEFVERYVFIIPCALAFSTGSLLYYIKRYLPPLTSPMWPLVSAGAWWGHVWMSRHFNGGPWQYGLYSSLIVSCFAILTLMNLKARELPKWISKTDKILGGLSYPIYLCHWGIGILVTYFFPSLTRENVWVFIISFPFVNALAFLLYKFIEEPIAALKTADSREAKPSPTSLVPTLAST